MGRVFSGLRSNRFRVSSSGKVGTRAKKKECSRSNFHAIIRLETLATQARFSVLNRINKIGQILKKKFTTQKYYKIINPSIMRVVIFVFRTFRLTD